LNHARIEHDAARDDMQPAAQRWLSAVESGLAAGRYGWRDLLEARAALFAARRRQLEAAAEYHLTLVAIEQLLGGHANP
jgi:outer membrane protein TolC